LCELDTSLGLNVARFITARFQLLQNSSASSRAQLPASIDHISTTKLLT
jgi:hypothetical protein